MTNPNRFHQERDFLLWLAQTAHQPKPRNQPKPILPTNYAAVYTSPTNNKMPMWGPCLIWRHNLNPGGYGTTTSQNGRTVLAHRAAYEISRGSIPPNTHIAHLCNRRSCVQPSHLYAATPQENTDDKKTKTTFFSLNPTTFEKLNRLSAECARHVWPEPPHTQTSLSPQPPHECKFTVPYTPGFPVGYVHSHPHEGFLCEVCYLPPPETSMRQFILESISHLDLQKTELQHRKQHLEAEQYFQNLHNPNDKSRHDL